MVAQWLGQRKTRVNQRQLTISPLRLENMSLDERVGAGSCCRLERRAREHRREPRVDNDARPGEKRIQSYTTMCGSRGARKQGCPVKGGQDGAGSPTGRCRLSSKGSGCVRLRPEAVRRTGAAGTKAAERAAWRGAQESSRTAGPQDSDSGVVVLLGVFGDAGKTSRGATTDERLQRQGEAGQDGEGDSG